MDFEYISILPEDYILCDNIINIAVNKKKISKSKIIFPEEINLNVLKTIYIKSHINKIFYKKKLSEILSVEKLQHYINLGLVYYKP